VECASHTSPLLPVFLPRPLFPVIFFSAQAASGTFKVDSLPLDPPSRTSPAPLSSRASSGAHVFLSTCPQFFVAEIVPFFLEEVATRAETFHERPAHVSAGFVSTCRPWTLLGGQE